MFPLYLIKIKVKLSSLKIYKTFTLDTEKSINFKKVET